MKEGGALPHGIRQVVRWYEKGRVDYESHFISLYVAYNTWYREVTGTANDRQALGALKKRIVLWDDYCNGLALGRLAGLMEQLVELTQREPLTPISRSWAGEVRHRQDWRSLIEYWYAVRCRVVHGGEVPAQHVWLAYATLEVFLEEVTSRMQQRLAKADGASLFTILPDVWQVDMQRAVPQENDQLSALQHLRNAL